MKNITFINAGAGSGKTYRLTKELYNAVNNNECAASEVMLTTFTKKAAEEIKVKAREKLLKEGKFAEANDLQNAYIGTVHSVGQKIIQKFWHYIGFPKEIRVIDEEDTDFYFRQAIAEIPTNSQLEDLIRLNYKFNPFNEHKTLDVDRWKKDLFEIIVLSRTNHIDDFTNSKNQSLAYAKKIFNSKGTIIDYTILKPIVEKIIQIGKELPEKGHKERIKLANQLRKIKLDNIQYSQLKIIRQAISEFQSPNNLIGDINNQAIVQLEDYHRSQTLLKDIEAYNSILFDLANESIKMYSKYKQEIGLIDYSDMENGFLRLLEFKDVRTEISKTIKLIMVDEFQDSSPIQLAIFIKLSEIVDRSIWVGDPKQSIYSFRGTDPVLIDAIVTRFEQKENSSLAIDNLKDSWRSRPEIVDAVNRIFTPAFKPLKEDRITLNPVRTNKAFNKSALHQFNFVELNEKGKPDTTNYSNALAKGIVKVLSEEWIVSNKTKSFPSKENPDAEVVAIEKIKGKDIAILCKSNSDVTELTGKLKNLGIKVSAESDDLKKSAEYILIIALVKLILSEHNVLAKSEVILLSTKNDDVAGLIDDRLDFLSKLPSLPSELIEIEYSIEDLIIEKEKYEGQKKTYYDALNKWGNENLLISGISSIFQELKELPVPQLLEHLVNRLDIYSLVTKWENAGQRRNNIQKIIEYAYKYDERCINMNLGASISGFVYYLQMQESLTDSVSADDDAVNVMTYHKSKGLEWPVVVLANLHKDVDWGFVSRNIFGVFIENKSEVNLDTILADRNIISLPWMFGAQNAIISEDFDNHIISTSEFIRAQQKHHNELKRVLYVGMTRARDYMITTAIAGHNKFPWMNILNNHSDWEFGKVAKADNGVMDIFDRGTNFEVHKLELSGDQIVESKVESHYFDGKNINVDRISAPYFISPSKVKNNNKIEATVFADIQNRIPTGGSAKDKEGILGNCLHDILYLFINNKQLNTTDNNLKQIETIILKHKIDHIINANEVLISIETLYKYLKNTFNPKVWHTELALECEINGQLFKGEADLVLETSEGYILFDYKSYLGGMDNVLNISSNGSENPNFAGKHAGQLDTYSKMIEYITDRKVIKTFIYYTILGKLVEISKI